MKADAWECGHRMPFIVRWPGIVPANSVSDELICFTDLMATFAELVGVELAPDEGPDSFSFLGVLFGTRQKNQPVRDYLVIPSGNNTLSIRQGKWKLIEGLGSGGFSKPKKVKPISGQPAGQLYDLASDLGETKNLYQHQPELVAKLRSALEKIVKKGRSR